MRAWGNTTRGSHDRAKQPAGLGVVSDLRRHWPLTCTTDPVSSTATASLVWRGRSWGWRFVTEWLPSEVAPSGGDHSKLMEGLTLARSVHMAPKFGVRSQRHQVVAFSIGGHDVLAYQIEQDAMCLIHSGPDGLRQ